MSDHEGDGRSRFSRGMMTLDIVGFVLLISTGVIFVIFWAWFNSCEKHPHGEFQCMNLLILERLFMIIAIIVGVLFLLCIILSCILLRNNFFGSNFGQQPQVYATFQNTHSNSQYI